MQKAHWLALSFRHNLWETARVSYKELSLEEKTAVRLRHGSAQGFEVSWFSEARPFETLNLYQNLLERFIASEIP